MRTLKLLSLSINGFKSFSTPVTVEFTQEPGLKFMQGDNKREPRLAANGAGKSSLWDALVWCLYGSTARGLKTSDCVSWGSKKADVSATFGIAYAGNKEGRVAVRRSGPPSRLFMYDFADTEEESERPAEQSDVDIFIGLNRARFLQSVLFGQLVPLFIDLPLPERANLLDGVLDLGMWLRLSQTAGEDAEEQSVGRSKAKLELARVTGRIEELEPLEKLRAEEVAWQETAKAAAEDAINYLEAAELEEDKLSKSAEAAEKAFAAAPDLTVLQSDMRMLQREVDQADLSLLNFDRELAALKKSAEFYQHTKVCDVCKQGISKDFADQKVANFRTLYQEALTDQKEVRAKRDANNKKYSDARKAFEDVQLKRNKLEREFLDKRASLKSHEALIQERERRALSLTDALDKNPITVRIKDRLTREALLDKEKLTYTRAVNEASASIDVAEFWKAAFKRVRLFLIKRILATLEAEVNSAATVLGLVGWSIAFSTETTTKSDTTKFGIQIAVTSPVASAPWEVWSGGESQRIRLAVAIGLSSMIQRMAGVSIDFEIWDEPSAGLSQEGIEDMLECLRYRADVTGKSVWLVDHRSLTFSGFSEIWQVTKTENGSDVKQLMV